MDVPLLIARRYVLAWLVADVDRCSRQKADRKSLMGLLRQRTERTGRAREQISYGELDGPACRLHSTTNPGNSVWFKKSIELNLKGPVEAPRKTCRKGFRRLMLIPKAIQGRRQRLP